LAAPATSGGEGAALTVGDRRAVSGAGGAVGPRHSQSDMWLPASLVACDPWHVRATKTGSGSGFQVSIFEL
jgi:hypothetical protein